MESRTQHRSYLARSVPVGIFSVALWLLLPGLANSADVPPDLILHNGKIVTVDKSFSTAQAVAIRGNKIAAVGTNQDVLQQAGPNTQKIDLEGRTVIPGLIDTHMDRMGSPQPYRDPVPAEKQRSFNVDWRAVTSKDDVLLQIRQIMEKYKPPAGEWLGFANNLSRNAAGPDAVASIKILYDDLNRYDLDKVIPNNPAVLTMAVPEENALFLNSAALDILFKNEGDFIKKYGRYWVGSDGKPDGHIEAVATRLLLAKYWPQLPPEELARGIRLMFDELNAQGITGMSTKARTHMIDAYKLLESQGKQTVRFAYGLGWDYFGKITDTANGLKPFQKVIGTGTDINWINSMAPSSTDGAGTRACTSHKRAVAYGALDSWFPVGQCYTDSEYRGGGSRPANISGNYFRDWIMSMGRNGLRLANDHVAGDRSASNIIGFLEEIQRQYGPNATKNWAFDHCTFMDPKDIPRAKKLGMMFSCAPKYIIDNSPAAAKSYGDQYANTFVVPVKSIIDAGMEVAFETAVDTYDLADLQLFITRKDKNGKVWGPQERLDRQTALKTITQWAADYMLKGDKLGSIETGKLADLVVLDKDYMTIAVEEIGTIQPQLTIFDGRIVFVHTDYAREHNLKPAGAVIGTFKELFARRPKDVRGGVGETGG